MSAPTFSKWGPRGFEHGGFSDPLPPVLAGLVAESREAKQHRTIAARCAELRGNVLELRREVEQKTAELEAKRKAAAESAKPMPRPEATTGAGKRLEGAEAELQALESALARSADTLMEAAMPHLAEATELVSAEQEETLGPAAARDLAALEAKLERGEELGAEKVWLLTAARGTRAMAPYSGKTGRDNTVRVLRQDFRDRFERFHRERAKHQAAFEEQRSWESEQAAQAERHREWELEEAKSRSVRYEGMKLTHKGGVPVERGEP